VALESVLKKKGIKKLNGEVFRKNGRFYVPCVHPAYVLRNPDAIGMFRKALKVAYRLGRRSPTVEKLHYITVETKRHLREFTDLLKNWLGPIAHDIEGASLSHVDKYITPRLACAGWSWEAGYAVCFPIFGRYLWPRKIEFRPEEALEAMREIYESGVRHIMHFGKYDAGYSEAVHGIILKNYWYDTGLASYALDERKGGHNLDDWSFRVGMGGHKAIIRDYQNAHLESNPSKPGGDMCMVPLEILAPYNMGDNDVTIRVFNVTYPKLKEQGLYEMPFRFPLMYHNWTCQRMEMNGVKLDLHHNKKLKEEFPATMDQLEAEIKEFPEYKALYNHKAYRMVKKTVRRVKNYVHPPPDILKKVKELVAQKFENMEEKGEDLVNIDGDDKRDLVYKFGGYKARFETEKGLPSVKMEFLEAMQLARPTPLLDKIIVRSKYKSSYDKYVRPIKEWAGTDERTHTSYLPHGTVTGRVSSQDPNHENFPKRSNGELERQLVKELRTQFCATNDDYILCEADEKQIEMRLFCDRAGDDVMLEEFLAFKDPHAMGAMAGFRLTEEEWNKLPKERQKELRNKSKNAISFGLLYGRSAEALAADMGWSLEEANEFIDRYFGKYDDCYLFRGRVEEVVKKYKMVASFFGRIRRLPEIDSDRAAVAAEALRQAINAPIQGDASDITWCAGHRLEESLIHYKMKSKVIIGVHDALYTDIYRKELQDVMELKFKYMTDRKWFEQMNGHYFTVPLDIDMSLGPNLGNMQELKRITQGVFDFEVPAQLAA